MISYGLDYSGDNVEDPDRPYAIRTVEDLDQHLEILGHRFGDGDTKLLAQLGRWGDAPDLLFGIDELGDTAGRAVIQWLPSGEFGWHPDAPPTAEDLEFDGRFIAAVKTDTTYGPDESRVSPELVKAAVREYVRTGARPTTIQWRLP
jgi:hypothetical protein